MRHLVFLLPLLVMLSSCGLMTPRNQLGPEPQEPQLVSTRYSINATAAGVELMFAGNVSAASLPIDSTVGPAKVVLVDGSYEVGRRAEYSEFLLSIRNESDSDIYAPKLEVVEFHFRNGTDPARGAITTSDNGVTGVGALFDYGWTLGTDQRLSAGASTSPRRWRIDDPQVGFQPYVLTLELTYYTSPVEPRQPSTPGEVVADFRGAIDPVTGEFHITDLRSPYFTVHTGPAEYHTDTERLYTELILGSVREGVFLDDLTIHFEELRLVSNDPHRAVVLDVERRPGEPFAQSVGSVGPWSYVPVNLHFRGVSSADLQTPRSLGPLVFRAKITGTVDPVQPQGAAVTETARTGHSTRIDLPGAAFTLIRDDLQPGSVLEQDSVFSLQEVTSVTLVERLQAFEGLRARGPIVRFTTLTPNELAADFVTLGLRVTPEVRRAHEAGAHLAVLEFSSMRSPATVYWDILSDEIYSEDIEAGWVSVRAFFGNMLFGSSASDAIHSYYAVVALDNRTQSRTGPTRGLRPMVVQAPYLLGPDETYTVDVTVNLPEAESAFLPNLTNPVAPSSPLITTPDCNTPDAREAGLNDAGCSNDEVGFRGRLNDGTLRRNPHMGMDLRADSEDEIFPVADGTVVFADYVRNETQVYGCTVIVRHQNGYESLYAHLNGPRLPDGSYDCQLGVNEGDRVTSGKTILGNAGGTNHIGATAPYPEHLHLSISPSGFNSWAPNTSMVVSPRGVCNQINNFPNGIIHLDAELVLSYPRGDIRVKESLVSGRFTGTNQNGVGICVTDQLTFRYQLDRELLLAKIGTNRSRTLAYLAVEYSWKGLHQPGPGAIVGPRTEVDPQRPFRDSVTAVGVTGVSPKVVRLGETALVEGFGFGANQLQGTAEMNVYYHSASNSGPSGSPDLEAQIVGESSTALITEVPGPSPLVQENAAWGKVGVRFANGRNSTYEETSNSVEVAPVVENVRVVDGFRSGFARGGMTLAVAGHGFLSGPTGEASFAADLASHSQPQELTVNPRNLTPIGFELTVPDEMYSGPAVIETSVEHLTDQDNDSITIYPYITSSPRTGAYGQTATITGTGLGPDVAVHFNGVALQASGSGTSVSFEIGDHIRSGALYVTAAGQQSGNGVRFVALPTLTVDVVDAETGEAISATLDYIAADLDDPSQGVYDEDTYLFGAGLTSQRTDQLFGSGLWRVEANADGYEPGSSERMLTTTPEKIAISLRRIIEPEPEQ